MGDLRLDLQIDHDRWQEAFRDIGSQEYPRAIQFALDETAKVAVGRFRHEMPSYLGQKAGGWAPNSRTLNAVSYERSRDYDAVARTSDLRSSIYIKEDRSAVLKYLFGQGTQIRPAGDVGLADDRILVPDAANLRAAGFLESLRNGANGRLPPNLKASVAGAAPPSTAGHAAAMRLMVQLARATTRSLPSRATRAARAFRRRSSTRRRTATAG